MHAIIVHLYQFYMHRRANHTVWLLIPVFVISHENRKRIQVKVSPKTSLWREIELSSPAVTLSDRDWFVFAFTWDSNKLRQLNRGTLVAFNIFGSSSPRKISYCLPRKPWINNMQYLVVPWPWNQMFLKLFFPTRTQIWCSNAFTQFNYAKRTNNMYVIIMIPFERWRKRESHTIINA